MDRPAVTARTPTSAPGSDGLTRTHPPSHKAGFSLVELLVVLLLLTAADEVVSVLHRVFQAVEEEGRVVRDGEGEGTRERGRKG